MEEGREIGVIGVTRAGELQGDRSSCEKEDRR